MPKNHRLEHEHYQEFGVTWPRSHRERRCLLRRRGYGPRSVGQLWQVASCGRPHSRKCFDRVASCHMGLSAWPGRMGLKGPLRWRLGASAFDPASNDWPKAASAQGTTITALGAVALGEAPRWRFCSRSARLGGEYATARTRRSLRAPAVAGADRATVLRGTPKPSWPQPVRQ